MECKKSCYWNYNNQCCPEDKEGMEKAEPTTEKACPTFLRKDFEKHFHQTYDNILYLVKKRSCAELEAIEKFILSQRKGQKQ